MKHFRILQIKNKNKYYIIQYNVSLFIGLNYWTNYNNIKYNKYEDAINIVKENINKSDYETNSIVYHYIDAYKLYKIKK